MVVHHEYNCLSFQATFQCLNPSSSKDQWVQQCARQATSDRPPLRLLYSSVAKLVEHTSQSNNCRVAASSRWPIIHPKLISLISDIGCLLHICYTLCFFVGHHGHQSHLQVPLEPADFSSSLPWVQGLHPCDDEEVESVHKASFDVRKDHKAALWSFVSVHFLWAKRGPHVTNVLAGTYSDKYGKHRLTMAYQIDCWLRTTVRPDSLYWSPAATKSRFSHILCNLSQPTHCLGGDDQGKLSGIHTKINIKSYKLIEIKLEYWKWKHFHLIHLQEIEVCIYNYDCSDI